MNVHEHQAKALLRDYGLAMPQGRVAFSVAEATAAAAELGGPVYVVKSQIHAGGRGAGHFADDPDRAKGGGVRVVKSAQAVTENAKIMLGNTLVTKQTGPAGKQVGRLYIEEGVDIARELYLAVLVDRGSARITLVASTEGGMEIEDVAKSTPEKIISVAIDPATGLQNHHKRTIAFGLGLTDKAQMVSAFQFLSALYQAFTERDAEMVEINPLIVTGGGDLMALDAKMSFDNNALFRQPDLGALRDTSEEDEKETEAEHYDLNYVALDGEIGCMVNGAGLAMATMDIIKLYGAAPANFLDVGGGATAEQVTAAFKIILSDPQVKGILVNIFGGIMRCDVIAEGLVVAAKEVALPVPLVVRLEGTNVDQGKRLMAQSDLPIISADNLADAAAQVVKAVKGA